MTCTCGCICSSQNTFYPGDWAGTSFISTGINSNTSIPNTLKLSYIYCVIQNNETQYVILMRHWLLVLYLNHKLLKSQPFWRRSIHVGMTARHSDCITQQRTDTLPCYTCHDIRGQWTTVWWNGHDGRLWELVWICCQLVVPLCWLWLTDGLRPQVGSRKTGRS